MVTTLSRRGPRSWIKQRKGLMKDVNNIVGEWGLVEFAAELRKLHQAGQEETASALVDSLQANVENWGGDTEEDKEETENENAAKYHPPEGTPMRCCC